MTDSKQIRFNQKLVNIKNNESPIDDIEPDIQYSNLTKENLEYIVKVSKEAIKSNSENSINNFIKIAKFVKTEVEFEKKGVWNVIVGSDYGSYISYDKCYLVFFRIREVYFLVFRFGFDDSQMRIKDN